MEKLQYKSTMKIRATWIVNIVFFTGHLLFSLLLTVHILHGPALILSFSSHCSFVCMCKRDKENYLCLQECWAALFPAQSCRLGTHKHCTTVVHHLLLSEHWGSTSNGRLSWKQLCRCEFGDFWSQHWATCLVSKISLRCHPHSQF